MLVMPTVLGLVDFSVFPARLLVVILDGDSPVVD